LKWRCTWRSELSTDNEIARPFQVYKGSAERSYQQASSSHAAVSVNPEELRVSRSALNRRRDAALSQLVAANVKTREK